MKIADSLGLTYVPVFYTGKFTKWSDFNHLIGKTAMSGAEGEGIVVKNMSNSKYTKIVSEKFRESHTPKPRQLTEKQIAKQNQMSEDTRIVLRKSLKSLHRLKISERLPTRLSALS